MPTEGHAHKPVIQVLCAAKFLTFLIAETTPMATSFVTSCSAALPAHGRIACRRCFTSDEQSQKVGKWRMVNDPAAWGAATPTVLLLGFSKGFTQADAFRTGRFEDIPFKDMRPRLTEELRLLGIIGKTETVDQKMVATEAEIGFGSFVRCSLSRTNKMGKLVCTGEVMPKAFAEEIAVNVETCARTYLAELLRLPFHRSRVFSSH
jgi:hypothetical protein